MEFKELIAELEKAKDTEEYKNYIEGLQQITPDRVSKFLETDEGKKFIQPTLDKYHSKGLETWKTNNLEKLLDEEIKKRFPGKSEKDIELEKIKSELDNMKRESTKKELTNKALKVATEKKLPIQIIDYLIGEDEEVTNKNLETFEKVFNDSLSERVQTEMKKTSYTPADNKNNNNNIDPFVDGLGLYFLKNNKE